MPRLTDIRECTIIAEDVVSKLKPFCEKIMIVGAIRRGRYQATKVEVVCQAITEIVMIHPDKFAQLDLFVGPPQPKKVRMRLKGFADAIEGFGFLELGDPYTGHFIKIVYDRKIAVEITIAEDYNWGQLIAVKTGDRYYFKDVLARAWYQMGYVNTEDGLRKRKECTKARSSVTGKRYGPWFVKEEIKMPWKPPFFLTEKDFFEFIKVPYKEPGERFVPYYSR